MHTPGPWTVHKQMVGPEVAGCMVIMPPDGPPVAYAADRVNARLIAAAPELLAALVRIRDSSGDPIMENIADSAIALAEGR